MLLETPTSITAGASGAIFGLLGAQAVILLKLKRSATPVLVVIGLNIFITQALFKVPLSSIYPGLIPFIFVNLVALVIITYVPELSLYLTQFVN